MSSAMILIAEENPTVGAFLADQLACDGYEILTANCRAHALALLERHDPQLVLADLDGQTLALLDALRGGDHSAAANPDTPMIVLSERADSVHRVRVLERGGDDIIAKPFSYPELRARVVAVLRRADRRDDRRQLHAGAVTIDLAAHQVRVADRPVELTVTEYELLVALARDPQRVFSRQELLRDVWGYRSPSRTVDSHLCRLRVKLRNAGGDRRLLVTVRGVGYRLDAGMVA